MIFLLLGFMLLCTLAGACLLVWLLLRPPARRIP